jgi:hypothetical protein
MSHSQSTSQSTPAPPRPAPQPVPAAQQAATLGTLLDLRAQAARALLAALREERAPDVEPLERRRQVIRGQLAAASQALAAVAGQLDGEVSSLLRALEDTASAADGAVAGCLAAEGHATVAEWLRSRGLLDAEAMGALLEDPWNARLDLVLLVGDGSAAAATNLAARGQRRILCLDRRAPRTIIAPGAKTPPLASFPDLEALDAAVVHLPWPYPGRLRAQALGRDRPAPLADVVARVQQTLRTIARASNESEHAVARFAHHALRNLPAIASRPSIAGLRGALAGVPAVVVSAGPSLDRNIAQLPALKGRVVIIAINQTVRALARAGVTPDLTVTIESLDVGYHFEGATAAQVGTLVLGASVAPSLFQVPSRRTLTFTADDLSEGWIYEAMSERASVESGGTVATTALALAAFLGCTPVISVGRDLALAGTRYYAEGAADGGHDPTLTASGDQITFANNASKRRVAEGAGGDPAALERLLAGQVSRLVPVPGFFGEPVTSTELFTYELRLLREVLRGLAADTRFINATEGGAFIEGMEHLTLAQAVGDLGRAAVDVRVDVEAVIRARLADGDANVAAADRRARLDAGLRTLQGELEQAVALAREAARLCVDKGSPAQRTIRQRRYQLAVDQLRDLSRRHRLISALVQRASRDILRREEQDWSSLSEVAEAERALYRAIETTIGELATGIARALTDSPLPNPP